jgi:hypothetical protein
VITNRAAGTSVERTAMRVRHRCIRLESSNSGLNTRYTLIFDPRTGMLLDFEQVLLEAGKLLVKVPATSSYTVWITTGHVNSIGDLPPAS